MVSSFAFKALKVALRSYADLVVVLPTGFGANTKTKRNTPKERAYAGPTVACAAPNALVTSYYTIANSVACETHRLGLTISYSSRRVRDSDWSTVTVAPKCGLELIQTLRNHHLTCQIVHKRSQVDHIQFWTENSQYACFYIHVTTGEAKWYFASPVVHSYVTLL